MQFDTEHLHYWMNAVRQSKNPMRTLDAFWSGQLKSKEWLIENLKTAYTWDCEKPARIDIHGGWVGVLASMLFQSRLPIRYIQSLDLDPECEPIATMMNKIEEQDGRFKAVTMDMCNAPVNGDIVINTSCEHITQEQYNNWLKCIPVNSLIVLQGNNYKIEEHIRTADTLEEFIDQSNIQVLQHGTLKLPMYTRWMVIGKKWKSEDV
jgi:hypothetical protein